MNCGASIRADFTKRRAGAASRCLDKARQRARQHDTEADRIDRPAHDVERAGPGVLGGGADLQAARRHARPAARRPRRHRRTAPRKSRRLWCCGRCETPACTVRRRPQARFRPARRAPDGRRATSPIRRRRSRGRTPAPAWPRAGNPFPQPTRASRLGVAMPVDDTVTMTSTSCAATPARSSAVRAACTNSALGAVEISLRALGPIVRFLVPFDRPHRIAPLDAGIDEHVGELRIAREAVRINAARGIGDRRLLEPVRGTAVASPSIVTGVEAMQYLSLIANVALTRRTPPWGGLFLEF